MLWKMKLAVPTGSASPALKSAVDAAACFLSYELGGFVGSQRELFVTFAQNPYPRINSVIKDFDLSVEKFSTPKQTFVTPAQFAAISDATLDALAPSADEQDNMLDVDSMLEALDNGAEIWNADDLEAFRE
jgi:hypothetical protein